MRTSVPTALPHMCVDGLSLQWVFRGKVWQPRLEIRRPADRLSAFCGHRLPHPHPVPSTPYQAVEQSRREAERLAFEEEQQQLMAEKVLWR